MEPQELMVWRLPTWPAYACFGKPSAYIAFNNLFFFGECVYSSQIIMNSKCNNEYKDLDFIHQCHQEKVRAQQTLIMTKPSRHAEKKDTLASELEN